MTDRRPFVRLLAVAYDSGHLGARMGAAPTVLAAAGAARGCGS